MKKPVKKYKPPRYTHECCSPDCKKLIDTRWKYCRKHQGLPDLRPAPLACFKCGTRHNFAMTGQYENGRLWAICKTCRSAYRKERASTAPEELGPEEELSGPGE